MSRLDVATRCRVVVSRASSGAGKGPGGRPPALIFRGLRLRRRLPCAPRARGPPHNSLRGLRPLRSNICGESVGVARCARGHEPCGARRCTCALAAVRPGRCRRRWWRAWGTRMPVVLGRVACCTTGCAACRRRARGHEPCGARRRTCALAAVRPGLRRRRWWRARGMHVDFAAGRASGYPPARPARCRQGRARAATTYAPSAAARRPPT